MTSLRPLRVVHALALSLASAWLAGCTGPRAALPAAPPAFVHGPYKDLTIAMDRDTGVIATRVGGQVLPVVDVLSRGSTLSWAFATGECGRETLGAMDAQKVADANVASFVRAGVDYIVSTGGEGAVFTCGSDAGMEAFIARYASPRLVGIDFDIESRQTPDIVDALVRHAAAAQRRHPALRFSFTLATLAAADGSRHGLNAQGRGVLAAIRRHGLTRYTINLMVMDYGPPTAAHCVVAPAGRACDMGASALQAADNLAVVHGVPVEQIALTAMIGVNDVADNDFTLADAELLARHVRERGFAGLHFWALDRDTPCPRPAQGASPLCSGLETVPALAFSRAFARGAR
jgi:hypothetical protein